MDVDEPLPGVCRALVQTVHVLCHEEIEPSRSGEIRKREVSRVRLGRLRRV